MTPAPDLPRGSKARLKQAQTRQEFIDLAVEALGGTEVGAITRAARRLELTPAVLWQWSNERLSVEGAVMLAEALGLPYEVPLKFATRRLKARVPNAPAPVPSAKPAPVRPPRRKRRTDLE